MTYKAAIGASKKLHFVEMREDDRSERRNDFLETMRGMLEPAEIERGCLSYRLFEDVENSNVFFLMEK